jgi:predicted metal-binding protein
MDINTENNLLCYALGDINGDGGWNVLDIVTLANCVLAQNCADLGNDCLGDLNDDGGYNVLDIVTLANCVLADNCGG